jgi:hypothetical protein
MNDQEQPFDAALALALAPPLLPSGFRARLMAAVARQGEYQVRQLQELRQGHLRLQRRTLLTLLAAAFSAGLLAKTAVPELYSRFGNPGLLALATAGAIAGVGIAATFWWRGEQL